MNFSRKIAENTESKEVMEARMQKHSEQYKRETMDFVAKNQEIRKAAGLPYRNDDGEWEGIND